MSSNINPQPFNVIDPSPYPEDKMLLESDKIPLRGAIKQQYLQDFDRILQAPAVQDVLAHSPSGIGLCQHYFARLLNPGR